MEYWMEFNKSSQAGAWERVQQKIRIDMEG